MSYAGIPENSFRRFPNAVSPTLILRDVKTRDVIESNKAMFSALTSFAEDHYFCGHQHLFA